MKAIGKAVGLGIVAAILGASTEEAIPSEGITGDAGKGKAMFQRLCATCHGPQGHGDGPLGNALVPPAANLTLPTTQVKPDAALLAAIKDGKAGTAMPSFKHQLTDQNAKDVLSFVRSLTHRIPDRNSKLVEGGP